MEKNHSLDIKIKVKKQIFEGRVNRMAMYLRTKVLEVIGSNHSVFYLTYFNDQCIAGKKMNAIGMNSFLSQAFQKGIVCDAKPLLTTYLPENKVIRVPPVKQLLNQLNRQFTPQEMAAAVCCLDYVVPLEQIEKVTRKIFYHYRRKGQFMNAYKMANTVYEWSPQMNWAKDVVHSIENQKYKQEYEGDDNKLKRKDPFYLEQEWFKKRYELQKGGQLQDFLDQQTKVYDILLHYIDQFQHKHSIFDYESFISLCHRVLNQTQTIELLLYLHEKVPTPLALKKDLLQLLLKEEEYETILEILQRDDQIPPLISQKQIESLFENIDSIYVNANIETIFKMILPLFMDRKEVKDKILRRFISILLKNMDVSTIYSTLAPMMKDLKVLPVIQDIKNLYDFSEDPEHLSEIGEIYYRFGQLNQAIDCFSMEMELYPNDPKPVHRLSQLYEEKGLVEEAKGLKQFSTQLLKEG